jgi:hypothetical protein
LAESKLERRLRAAARNGTPIRIYGGQTIDAQLIREILLSLPQDGADAPGKPIGLTIEGVAARDGAIPVIDGRIELSDVSLPEGAAVAPLAITRCVLRRGFAGARTRFASLRLKDCRFEDSEDGDLPTIDLGNARFDTGLYMAGLSPSEKDDYLWIRAAGIRVQGALDLSRSRFRAPTDHRDERLHCEQIIAGIDLTKAAIGADLYGLNGLRCEGCFHARGVHVKGNVWLGGATFEAPGLWALMLQRATIDGSLMLDAPTEWADGSGAHTPVVCAGSFKLRGARIGGDVHMQGLLIAGSADLSDIEVRNDLIFDAAVRDEICLQGCRVGGSVSLSGLRVGLAFSELTMRGGTIGRSLERSAPPPNCELLDARHAALASIPGAYLMETLWKEEDDSKLYQIGFIVVGGERLLLDGFASGLEAVLAKADYAIKSDGHAQEFLRLYGAYARGEAGFPIVDSREQALRFIADPNSPTGEKVKALHADFFKIEEERQGNTKVVTACVVQGDRLSRCAFTLMPGSGSIKVVKKWLEDGPHVDREATAHGSLITLQYADRAELLNAINRREWPLPSAVTQIAQLTEVERKRTEKLLSSCMAAAFDLRGEVNLGHLTCDLLKDRGGDGWGPRVHFELNHFVYRYADWRADYLDASGQPDARSMKPKWRQWISRRHSISGTARYDESRDNWEGRRSWLFQQYYRVPDKEPEPDQDPPKYPAAPFYSFRKIKGRHYRPQPLEQLARAARAEGRESAVAHSEILKQAIEWRHFNRAARWRLGYVAIIVASLWLMFSRPVLPSIVATLLVSVLTLIFMARGTVLRAAIARRLDRIRDKPRHRSRNMLVAKLTIWVLYGIPALLLFVMLDWYKTPFHFLVAFALFVGVRLLTTLAHGLFRGGFGYLRRPVRAIVTLIGAFIVGWVGVAVANRSEMLVANAEPVATVASDAVPPVRDDQTKTNRFVMGNPRVGHDPASFSHEISCRPVISEPLYALDVLIPIVDLGEERRCEIRRRPKEEEGTVHKTPGEMSPLELLQNIPQLTVGNRRVWWWMKALYAIAGWVIVSLSILTFAHAMRAHAEPPTEHK